ncbi:hypothetical protein HMPREF9419_0419 [Prevotella nigrescens ATCC 33563]|nr:hypothetical protein HMPREF9419_0419 [Prevotella nigrescens ATCC 33563]
MNNSRQTRTALVLFSVKCLPLSFLFYNFEVENVIRRQKSPLQVWKGSLERRITFGLPSEKTNRLPLRQAKRKKR